MGRKGPGVGANCPTFVLATDAIALSVGQREPGGEVPRDRTKGPPEAGRAPYFDSSRNHALHQFQRAAMHHRMHGASLSEDVTIAHEDEREYLQAAG